MSLELVAPAKVNLTLEVLGRREDGYHEVATLMQAIDLVDRVTIVPSPTLQLAVAGEASDGVPGEGPANLAYRAALALMRVARNLSLGAQITLEKGIPAGAGLGGGSSDAATVLRGLNQFWGLGLGQTELEELAATLGSDVAFFLTGGAAECRGRGEIVIPLDDAPPLGLLLFIPAFQIEDKTRRMYSHITAADYSNGRSTRVACNTYGRGLLGPTDLVNVFDGHVALAAPPAGKAMALCRQAGLSVHATGSGPGFFSLSPIAGVPAALRRSLEDLGVGIIECHTMTRAACLAVQGG